LAGKRIALLGLAFKPNTDDMRGASSLVLAARLQAEGAHVRAFDPIAEGQARELMPQLDYASDWLDVIADADALVLVTEWAEFTKLDWRRVAQVMRGSLVIDGRNALDGDAVRSAGLIYEGVGRRWAPARQPASAFPEAAAGRDPGRRRGDAPASAHLHRAQARGAAGGQTVHLVPAGVAAPARHRRCDHVVRVPRDERAQCARRRLPAGTPPAVRGGARPAGHRRRPEGRRVEARRALRDAQRRRPHRPGPDRADRPARGDRRDRDAGPRAGARPHGLRRGEPGGGPLGEGLRGEAEL